MTNLKKKAREYRPPMITTSEDLECRWSKVVDFGNKVLLSGYFFMPKGNSYFAAVYEHTTADKSCEGEIKLTAISVEMFRDAGHALQWAMSH